MNLTPEQYIPLIVGGIGAVIGLLLAINKFIEARAQATKSDAAAHEKEVEARAKVLQMEAESDKLESETSSAAVKAVTEGFARKDTEVSTLQAENIRLTKVNGELEGERNYWKGLAEERWKIVEDKNKTIDERNKSLQDCVAANRTVNDRLLNVTAELESIRAQYASEIASTIEKHLNSEDKDKPNE